MQIPKTLTGLRGYDSIPDFAERSGTNPFKFKQVFKKYYGKAFFNSRGGYSRYPKASTL